MIKIYVGNLPYRTNDTDLQEIFSPYGAVLSAHVMMERDNPNRSRGFGFVEMESDEDAQKAVEMFNGKDFGGRNITVNEARPLSERPPRREGGFRRDDSFRSRRSY